MIIYTLLNVLPPFRILVPGIEFIYSIAAKNDISRMYKDEKQALQKGKRMKRGRLERIVTEICSARNIPYLPKEIIKTIRQREWRKRTFITTVGGLVSPLLAVEPKVVSIILQMCRIRQSLTPTQGLSRVNSVIHGTQIQT